MERPRPIVIYRGDTQEIEAASSLFSPHDRSERCAYWLEKKQQKHLIATKTQTVQSYVQLEPIYVSDKYGRATSSFDNGFQTEDGCQIHQTTSQFEGKYTVKVGIGVEDELGFSPSIITNCPLNAPEEVIGAQLKAGFRQAIHKSHFLPDQKFRSKLISEEDYCGHQTLVLENSGYSYIASSEIPIDPILWYRALVLLDKLPITVALADYLNVLDQVAIDPYQFDSHLAKPFELANYKQRNSGLSKLRDVLGGYSLYNWGNADAYFEIFNQSPKNLNEVLTHLNGENIAIDLSGIAELVAYADLELPSVITSEALPKVFKETPKRFVLQDYFGKSISHGQVRP